MSNNGAIPQIHQWSTRDAGPEAAVDYWRAIRRRAYVDVSLSPQSPDFFGDISYARYADFALSVKRSSGEKVHRSPALIARDDQSGDFLYVIFQRRGTGLVTQAGRTAEVSTGQAVIYDSSMPFWLDYQGPYEQVVVHLAADRAFTDAGLRRSTDLLAIPIAVDGTLSAVSAFCQNLAAAQADDPVGANLLATHAASVTSSLLSYAARTRAADDLPNIVQRQNVVAYIRRHLSDPDLDADRISTGCHVSRRTLYRLFEGTGQTVMGQVRTLRIDAARQLLAGPADLSVSAVARQVGFVSGTHFHRCFRTATGTTPGQYRECAGATSGQRS